MSRRGWAPGLDVGEAGLRIDGVAAVDLAREYGTPLWVLSRNTIEENFRRFLDAFRDRYPRTDVAYSMKSNSTLAIVRTLVLAGAKLDCSSEHEIELAIRCGARPGDIVVNGNGKSDGTLEACARGVLQVMHLAWQTSAHFLGQGLYKDYQDGVGWSRSF